MTSVPGPYGEDSDGYGANAGGYGPPRRPRRPTRLLSFLAVAVVAAGAGVGVTLAVGQPAASTTTTLPGAGAVPSPATSPSSGGTTGTVDVQGVVNKVEPGLVVINTTLTYSSEAAAGTGMVINSDGLVLTNQVNAGIVPGDSGGPLNSAAGQVIGMDTAGDSTSTGQQQPEGFAIPIDTALSIAAQIAAGQASSTVSIGYPPFIGIFTGSGTSSNPQTQAQQQEQQNGFGDGTGGLGGYNGYGGSASSPACYTSNTNLAVPTAIAPVGSGTLIDGTICGSPAATAGMTAGSVITAINGQAAGSPANLASILARFKPGDTISVTWVSPAGQQTTSTVHLTAGPPQ